MPRMSREHYIARWSCKTVVFQGITVSYRILRSVRRCLSLITDFHRILRSVRWCLSFIAYFYRISQSMQRDLPLIGDLSLPYFTISVVISISYCWLLSYFTINVKISYCWLIPYFTIIAVRSTFYYWLLSNFAITTMMSTSSYIISNKDHF